MSTINTKTPVVVTAIDLMVYKNFINKHAI
jgi:hypothetical protein